MKTILTIREINDIIACPRCKKRIFAEEGKEILCDYCRECYKPCAGTWAFIPSVYRGSSELWPVWDQLQANGLISYTEDPVHNLAVGEREDCLEFSRFCQFSGLVLDVGCGPQKWPAYFSYRSDETKFVGIDPLVGNEGCDFTRFIGLGEYLPFGGDLFDHVVFATSLDHFIDPGAGLLEACRVCKKEGEIDLWVGEKRPGAPRDRSSRAWFESLSRPSEAEDAFHLKRLGREDVRQIIRKVGLELVAEKVNPIDEYRANIFLKLKLTRCPDKPLVR
jgi:SAM-dependent methyltransferase